MKPKATRSQVQGSGIAAVRNSTSLRMNPRLRAQAAIVLAKSVNRLASRGFFRRPEPHGWATFLVFVFAPATQLVARCPRAVALLFEHGDRPRTDDVVVVGFALRAAGWSR